MVDLTADKRKAMPQSEFAGPGKSFPVNDANHARLAISGATRAERAGNISVATEEKIKAKARAKLGSAPRDHALAMASADHLHRMGHISSAQHKEIRSKAEAGMAKAKRTFGAMG